MERVGQLTTLQRAPLLIEGRSGGGGYDPLPSESPLSKNITMLFGFLRRQWWVIFAILPFTLGLAIFYLHKTPEGYTAIAKIMVDTSKIHFSAQPAFGDDPVSMAIVDSQTEIMKSDKFALAVIKKLDLLQYQEFTELNLMQRVARYFGANINVSQAALEQRALIKFHKKLSATRLPLTMVIDVAFQSPNPERAAMIANTIADSFIREHMDSRFENLGKATKWLDDRLNELRVQATNAERAVIDYKKKHNIVDPGGHLISEQQLSELNVALVKARANTVETKAKLDQVGGLLNVGNDIDPTGDQVTSVADALHNQLIATLRAKYADIQEKQHILGAKLGANHGAVVNYTNQLREIRRSIFEELRRIAETYRNDYEVAKVREASIQAAVDKAITGTQTTGVAQVELRQLESAAQSYRSLYNSFQTRYTEFAQQQSFPVSEAQITQALPPAVASSPKSLKILGMAAAGGLVLGFALAIFREVMDRVFRTVDQVQSRLKTNCVAILPRIAKQKEPRNLRRVQRMLLPFMYKPDNDEIVAERTITLSKGHLMRHIVEEPLSPFTEAVRSIKLAADLTGKDKDNRDKIFGLTSSIPNEGKSTISASLAQLCAHSGARAILVDCDLRRQSLTQALAPKAKLGIVDVVNEAVNINDVIWTDPKTRLSFLPATGARPHTSEILASTEMKALFSRLRQTYDYVIVDLSPLVPIVDVRAAIHLVDASFFVIEWGKTRIDVVERALDGSTDVYQSLLGAVLNKVDMPKVGRYDRSGYTSQYVFYGKRY